MSARVTVGLVLFGMILAARAEGQLGCCRIKGTLTCTNATKAQCDQIAVNAGPGKCTVFVEGEHCLSPAVSCSGVGFPPGSFTLDDVCETCATCPDTTQPTCILAKRRAGPPAEIDIRVQDTGIGLAKIEVIRADNSSVPIPPFESGTVDPVVVTATKVDPLSPSRVELRVFDLSGNSTTCDPVLTQVVRATGKPASESHAHLEATEDTVTIDNGSPGLRNFEILMNGQSFRVAGLEDGESRTLDVSSAMLPGNANICVLKSYGKPGASALVLIWDGEP